MSVKFLENRLLYLLFERATGSAFEQAPIQCIASFTVVEDKVTIAKKLFLALQNAARQEDGCLSCDLFIDERSVNKFALVGEWCSIPHLQAHLVSQHMADFNRCLKDQMGVKLQPPAIKFYKFVQ